MSDNPLAWPSPSSLAPCTDHQREVIAKSFAGPVGILTGGPGTGKTFTVAAAVREIAEKYGLGAIAAIAPTGKAAVRCTEAFGKLGLKIEATTIHRFLGVGRNGHDGNGWGFLHGPDNPVEVKFLIIDEASMLDTDLASSVFSALRLGTHVLMVGDPYQLPPVGHGAPLRDMIEVLPSGELTKIERNSGDICRVCNEIRSGKGYRPSIGGAEVTSGRNVRHWETKDALHSIGKLEDLLCSPPASIDPIWDVQVLCAVNEKSDLSRKAMNKRLQDLLNPSGERVDGCPFRLGDKVICTSNSLLPLDSSSELLGCESTLNTFVANGEIGKVVWLQKKLMKVEFESPKITVKVLMGKPDEENGDSDRNRPRCDFDLAYAITVHKAQGSQSPITIVLIDDSGAANQVCSREWHMTAMSRPEKLLITIGKRHIVDKQSKRVGLRDRQTYLKELLKEQVAI